MLAHPLWLFPPCARLLGAELRESPLRLSGVLHDGRVEGRLDLVVEIGLLDLVDQLVLVDLSAVTVDSPQQRLHLGRRQDTLRRRHRAGDRLLHVVGLLLDGGRGLDQSLELVQLLGVGFDLALRCLHPILFGPDQHPEALRLLEVVEVHRSRHVLRLQLRHLGIGSRDRRELAGELTHDLVDPGPVLLRGGTLADRLLDQHDPRLGVLGRLDLRAVDHGTLPHRHHSGTASLGGAGHDGRRTREPSDHSRLGLEVLALLPELRQIDVLDPPPLLLPVGGVRVVRRQPEVALLALQVGDPVGRRLDVDVGQLDRVDPAEQLLHLHRGGLEDRADVDIRHLDERWRLGTVGVATSGTLLTLPLRPLLRREPGDRALGLAELLLLGGLLLALFLEGRLGVHVLLVALDPLRERRALGLLTRRDALAAELELRELVLDHRREVGDEGPDVGRLGRHRHVLRLQVLRCILQEDEPAGGDELPLAGLPRKDDREGVVVLVALDDQLGHRLLVAGVDAALGGLGLRELEDHLRLHAVVVLE